MPLPVAAMRPRRPEIDGCAAVPLAPMPQQQRFALCASPQWCTYRKPALHAVQNNRIALVSVAESCRITLPS